MTEAPRNAKATGGVLQGCLVLVVLAAAFVGAWIWLLFDDAAFARRWTGVCAATPLGITVDAFKAQFDEGAWRFTERPSELWALHVPRVHPEAAVFCIVQVDDGRVVGRGPRRRADGQP